MNLLLAKNAVREIRRMATYPPQHQMGVHIDLAIELLNWVVLPPDEVSPDSINPLKTELLVRHAMEDAGQLFCTDPDAPLEREYCYLLSLRVLVQFEALIRADCAARAGGAQ
ncbi:MAG: hypothetical protein V4857_14125 [Pseudomonadota bacterium]